MDDGDRLAIEIASLLFAVIEPDQGDPDRRPLNHPGLVAPGHEDLAALANAVQHLTRRAAPNGIRREQPGALEPTLFNSGAGLLEPVGDEVRLAGHLAVVNLEEGLDVTVPQLATHLLAAKKRRITYHHVRRGPLRLLWISRVGQIEDGVPALDRLNGFQHRVLLEGETVAEEPLQMADPDGDLGKLLGEGVEFDSLDHLGADADVERELAFVHLGQEEQDFLFQLVQERQGDIEEVPGAAGGVEDADLVEPATPKLLDRLARFLPEAGGSGTAAGLGSLDEKRLDPVPGPRPPPAE